MGKHFGKLGVIIRGMLTYELAPQELKTWNVPKLIKKSPRQIWDRTTATLFYWLIPFTVGYLTYRLVEWGYWKNHRKNPALYLSEKPPPPVLMCRRVKEPRPRCKSDWEYEEYPCKTGEMPDPEFKRMQDERNAEIAAGD